MANPDNSALLADASKRLEQALKHVDISEDAIARSEIQSCIFEPFFTTKTVGKGSGLGLDNVRRIVENRHRGSISLESEPGKTCFTICLPVNICET